MGSQIEMQDMIVESVVPVSSEMATAAAKKKV